MKRIPVELLILSGNTIEGDADTRLAELRDDDRTANLPIVVMDAGPVEQRVALLESGADLCFPGSIAFGELQASLSALMKRTVRPPAAPPPPEPGKPAASTWYALQGELRDFPLSWLLQVLTYDARTAAILIQERGNQGAIYLEQGVARHAWTRATWTNQSWTRMATGEDALRQMLRWSGGSFVVRPEERTPEQTIHRSLMHLLLDAAVADDHGRANAIFGTVDAEE
jgi:DNA-binding response OmpR family regulator